MAGTDWVELARYVARARPDISSSVTHWTRANGKRTAFENLINMINMNMIIASRPETGFIKGKHSATCFSEAPVAVMARVFRIAESDNQTRNYVNWEPYGLSFLKPVIYSYYNGRPVIYFSNDEYKNTIELKGLTPELGWRVVAFDQATYESGIEAIDWTHEREWRVRGDVDFGELKGLDRPLAVVRTTQDQTELLRLFPDDNNRPICGVLNTQDIILT
jgi:hypothetical protein